MKKTILFTLLLISAASFCFAQEADEYADEYIEEETPLEKKSETKNKFKDYFSFGNTKKILEGQEISLFTKNIAGQLKQQKTMVAINLDNELPGFGCPYLASYSYVFMEREDIKLFENAFNQYEQEFEEKKLDRKGRKLYRKYGKNNVSIKWGSIKALTPNNATGYAYLGYEFINKSPYFTITIFPLKNKYYEKESTAQRESPTFKYYFTKAQARELIENLSEENIGNMLHAIKSEEIIDSEADNY